MPIIPRHQRLLEELRKHKERDMLGGIGWGALRDEDDPLSYDQLFQPLTERGLIEDLTDTDLGSAGRYFVRITALGERCLALGMMVRNPRITSDLEIAKLTGPPPAPAEEEIVPAGAHA